MSGYLVWGLILLLVIGGALFLRYRYPEGSTGRRRMKWSFWGLVFLIVGLFLNYTLPSHDVVRITNTYNRLTTVSWENAWAYASPDTGTGEGAETRDIRFIEAVHDDDSVVVFRNEDTGWVWPPYFKYDSSNLHAEASNLRSDKAAPQWVMVTYYGWRLPILSIYPNAVKVRAVDSPDATVLPWVNILILSALALLVLMLRRMWLQFRERTIDPVVEDAGDFLEGIDAQADAARAQARGMVGRFKAWLNTWRAKPKG
ncbi:DUF1523 family protein [Frigidibacter sp. SD6-1]|uniref:DUF1523 family protein n=1 Tax=Frigidibacter sp. SD6-1 TaxID=3032581 RepID=UPI0032E7FB39